MAIDYEKLKKAKQELEARMNRGGGGTSMKFWKPANGKNVIRILPPWTDEGVFANQFYREVHQHWNVAGEDTGPTLCPKKTPELTSDKECPICDLLEQLKAQKSNVEAQELVKELRAKLAYFLSIVDINDPVYSAKDIAEWKKERPDSECPFEAGDVKIQCYASTSTTFDQILNIVIANDMDITDLSEGNNVVIMKAGKGLQTKYTVTPEIKKTKTPGVTATTKLPDLSKVGKVPSFEDMLKALGDGPATSFAGLLTANAGPTATTTNTGDSSWVSGDGGSDLAAEMRSQLDSVNIGQLNIRSPE